MLNECMIIAMSPFQKFVHILVSVSQVFSGSKNGRGGHEKSRVGRDWVSGKGKKANDSFPLNAN